MVSFINRLIQKGRGLVHKDQSPLENTNADHKRHMFNISHYMTCYFLTNLYQVATMVS